MDHYSSGEWHVKPGREDEFVRAWRDFAEASGAQFKSNTWSLMLRDGQDPRHFRSLALWLDEHEVAAWRQSEMFQQKTQALAQLVEKVDISVFDSVATVGSAPQALAPSAARY